MPIRMQARHFGVLGAMILAFGCRKTTNFTGTSPVSGPGQIEVGTLASSAQIASKNQKNCNAQKGITSVKLLTPEVVQGTGSELKYEVSLIDCDGKVLPFDAAFIAFDMDAVTREITNELPFHVRNSDNTEQANGTLAVVGGSDLFGNTGNYFHHRSTQPIRFHSPTKTLIFTLDISKQIILKPRSMQFVVPAKFQVPTYLKLGEATPAQTDVGMAPL